MFKELQSEYLKHKGTFNLKLLWIAPLLTVVLSIVLLGSANMQNGAYNWWSTFILPGTLAIVVSLSGAREKRKNRHGLLAVAVSKGRLWLSQILLYTLFLMATVLCFYILISAMGTLLGGGRIPLSAGFYASLLLFVGFAWQMPLWMWVTDRVGSAVSMTVAMVCNFVTPIFAATTERWWLPFAIPARLMCPVLGIEPNGLWLSANSPLLDEGVVLPGVAIAFSTYVFLTVVTTLWFNKREVS